MYQIHTLDKSIGIARADKLKKYLTWGNIERIIKDAASFIEHNPYSEDMIREVLERAVNECA